MLRVAMNEKQSRTRAGIAEVDQQVVLDLDLSMGPAVKGDCFGHWCDMAAVPRVQAVQAA